MADEYRSLDDTEELDDTDASDVTLDLSTHSSPERERTDWMETPPLKVRKSAKTYSRTSIKIQITEIDESEELETIPKRRPLRTRTNLPGKIGKKCEILTSTPDSTPIRTRSGKKHQKSLIFSSVSPIPTGKKKKNKYLTVSDDSDSESRPFSSPIRTRNGKKYQKPPVYSPISPIPTRKTEKTKPSTLSDDSDSEFRPFSPPIRTKNGKKQQKPLTYSQISPIPTRKNRKTKHSTLSDDSDTEFRSFSPILDAPMSPVSPNRELRKKIAVKAELFASDFESSGDERVVVPKKRKSRGKAKKKTEKGDLSPIRKCPDDFVEHDFENPVYYLKDNLKRYEGVTSAESRFQEMKRVNELRNVENPPRKRGKKGKKDREVNMWAKKLNEEFSDIEQNYELCVESE